MEELLGTEKQACPYCGVILEKFPQSKTKCKDCGNYIYSKTRPQDRKKVLLKESEVKLLESQWDDKYFGDLLNDKYFGDRLEFEAVKNKLLQRDPNYTDYDVMWTILNNRVVKQKNLSDLQELVHLTNGQADVQFFYKKYSDALDNYCRAIYLDMINQFRIFKLFGNVPNYKLRAYLNNQVIKICELLNIRFEDLESIFLESTQPYFASMKLELSPEQSWKIFNNEITGVDNKSIINAILYVNTPPIEKQIIGKKSKRSAGHKSKTAALLWCIFLGYFGGHYFYVDRIGKGLLYFFTVGLFGIGWLVDIFVILSGSFRDAAGNLVQ